MTCTITGTAGKPDGTVYASATFTFTRLPSIVSGQGGRVVAPVVTTETSDVTGAVDFDILPGNYAGSVGGVVFPFSVPEAASADFADCVTSAATIITNDLLLQTQEARDEAIAARDEGNPEPVYATVAALVADAAGLASRVATIGAVRVRVMGGLSSGDGGYADLLVIGATGSETTVTANGLSIAPGFEIMLGNGVKATWPNKTANAVTMGARTITYATQAQSWAANDALLNAADDMFADGYSLSWVGDFWIKNGAAHIQDKSDWRFFAPWRGAGRIYQADHLDGGGSPFYGAPGVPNAAINMNPVVKSTGGTGGRVENLEVYGAWMRGRGIWLRQWQGGVFGCYVEKVALRGIAVGQTSDADPGSLDPDIGEMVVEGCDLYSIGGTAISQYGNTGGALRNNTVTLCWAEAWTTDACLNFEVTNMKAVDVARFDDMAGTPVAGIYNGISGNGGIGGAGMASCGKGVVSGIIFDGIGLDDPTNTSRDRPAIRVRPRKTDCYDITFSNIAVTRAHVAIHFEARYGVDTGFVGMHYCKRVSLAGVTLSTIRVTAGQGHVRIDEGCTYVTCTGVTADQAVKYFGTRNINSGAVEGTVIDADYYIHSSCVLGRALGKPMAVLQIGQSNDAITAGQTGGDQTQDRRVRLYDNDMTSNTTFVAGTQFRVAEFGQAPLNKGPSNNRANSYSFHAAKRLAARYDCEVYVYTVAAGGHGLEAFIPDAILTAQGWSRGGNQDLTSYAYATAPLALIPGAPTTYDMVISAQGNANRTDSVEKHAALWSVGIRPTMLAAGIILATTPFIMCDLLENDAVDHWERHQNSLRLLQEIVPQVRVVSSGDLPFVNTVDDKPHYTGEGLVTLGKRYADAFETPARTVNYLNEPFRHGHDQGMLHLTESTSYVQSDRSAVTWDADLLRLANSASIGWTYETITGTGHLYYTRRIFRVPSKSVLRAEMVARAGEALANIDIALVARQWDYDGVLISEVTYTPPVPVLTNAQGEVTYAATFGLPGTFCDVELSATAVYVSLGFSIGAGVNKSSCFFKINEAAIAPQPATAFKALATGTLALGLGTKPVVTVTPNATDTFTSTVPPAGTRATVIIVTSGTTSYTMTFGTGFKSTGTLTTGTVTAKIFTIEFISDGTTLNETSRTVAM